MSNKERDELGKLISSRHTMAAVDAILTAGYRKPRTITTAEELDALPAWSVALSDNIAYQKYPGEEVYDWAADGRFYATSQITLPATVIHEGAQS